MTKNSLARNILAWYENVQMTSGNQSGSSLSTKANDVLEYGQTDVLLASDLEAHIEVLKINFEEYRTPAEAPVF